MRKRKNYKEEDNCLIHSNFESLKFFVVVHIPLIANLLCFLYVGNKNKKKKFLLIFVKILINDSFQNFGKTKLMFMNSGFYFFCLF